MRGVIAGVVASILATAPGTVLASGSANSRFPGDVGAVNATHPVKHVRKADVCDVAANGVALRVWTHAYVPPPSASVSGIDSVTDATGSNWCVAGPSLVVATVGGGAANQTGATALKGNFTSVKNCTSAGSRSAGTARIWDLSGVCKTYAEMVAAGGSVGDAFTTNDDRAVYIPPGWSVVEEIPNVVMAANTDFFHQFNSFKTYAAAARYPISGATKSGLGTIARANTNSAFSALSDAVDWTADAAFVVNSGTGIDGPSAFFVRAAAGTRTINAIGDSLTWGTGDASTAGGSPGNSVGDAKGRMGTIGRAAGIAGIPIVNVAIPGEKSRDWVGTGTGFKSRLALLEFCPGVLYDAMGANDRNLSWSTFLAGKQWEHATWRALLPNCTKVVDTDIPPQNSSTDSYTTDANLSWTPVGAAWPNSTQYYGATGTAGFLNYLARSGDFNGVPLSPTNDFDRVLSWRDALKAEFPALRDGYFPTDGTTASYYQADTTHPASRLAALIAVRWAALLPALVAA